MLSSHKAMGAKNNTSEQLHAKDIFNRISLQKTWVKARKKLSAVKFGRLKLDYGDSRIILNKERRKFISEGLKI
jgi:hypothetical protein